MGLPIDTFIDFEEIGSPAAPSASIARVYAKTDGQLYLKMPDGTEKLILTEDVGDGRYGTIASGATCQPGDMYFSAATSRTGCLICQGQTVSRATYQNLYNAITYPVTATMPAQGANVITNISAGTMSFIQTVTGGITTALALPITDDSGAMGDNRIVSYDPVAMTATLLANIGAGVLTNVRIAPFGVLGDGKTVFRLPDMRAAVPMGQQSISQGLGSNTGAKLGTTGGSLDHSHTVPGLSVPALSIPALTVAGASVPGLSVPGLSVPGLNVPAEGVSSHSHTLGAGSCQIQSGANYVALGATAGSYTVRQQVNATSTSSPGGTHSGTALAGSTDATAPSTSGATTGTGTTGTGTTGTGTTGSTTSTASSTGTGTTGGGQTGTGNQQHVVGNWFIKT